MIHSDWLWDLRSECDDCIGRRSIYLTFDDGPHPLCTPQILNLLAEHRVPATFFVIGAYALGQPEHSKNGRGRARGRQPHDDSSGPV